MSGDTRFYVELPADEYGNTSMQYAVVEARSEIKDGREMLIPIAPAHHANGWPTGWYRSNFGGWVETDGPARELTYEEHRDLVASIPQDIKDSTANGIVKLKNGETVPIFMVVTVLTSLHTLIAELPIVFYELVMTCRDPEHRLFGISGQKLIDLGLIEEVDDNGRGHVHDLTRSIVISATEGEDFDMKLVSPLAA